MHGLTIVLGSTAMRLFFISFGVDLVCTGSCVADAVGVLGLGPGTVEIVFGFFLRFG